MVLGNTCEEAPSQEVIKETLSAGIEDTNLDGVVAAHAKSSGVNMVPDSQVVELGDMQNEHRRGTLPCQKIQNVDDSIQEGSNMVDKEGETGVVSNDSNMAQRNEEPEKEFVAKVSTSAIPATVTSLTNLERVERPSPSSLDVPLYKTHSNVSPESVSKYWMK